MKIKPRAIQICPVLNGFIVECGCQKVVFNSIDALVADLKAYYKSPLNTELHYRKEAINDTIDELVATEQMAGVAGCVGVPPRSADSDRADSITGAMASLRYDPAPPPTVSPRR